MPIDSADAALEEDPEVVENSGVAREISECVSSEEDDVKGRRRAMLLHITEVVQQLRGYRPSPNSSFASIGIDSLGSILFLRYLSDSLGGIEVFSYIVEAFICS